MGVESKDYTTILTSSITRSFRSIPYMNQFTTPQLYYQMKALILINTFSCFKPSFYLDRFKEPKCQILSY